MACLRAIRLCETRVVAGATVDSAVSYGPRAGAHGQAGRSSPRPAMQPDPAPKPSSDLGSVLQVSAVWWLASTRTAQHRSRCRSQRSALPGSLLIVQNPETNAEAYAWNWFALHAGQRLQLVNFWLIAVAFLASAFVQARSDHLFAIAFGVSTTGAVSSLAFMLLDIRTRQLVRVAENALRHFETIRVANGLDDVTELVKASHQARRSRFDSYRVIIQGLQLSVAGMFVLAAIYSLISR